MENQQTRNRKPQLGNELRKLIVRRIEDDGESAAEVAKSLGISASTIRTIIQRVRQTGRVNRIAKQTVEFTPGITLKQITINVQKKFNVVISKSTIDRHLREFKITLKKVTIVFDRVNDETRLNLRHDFALEFLPSMIPERERIFIDKCGLNLHLRRGYGCSLSGKRVSLTVPVIRGRNCTLLAAINNDGVVHYKIFYCGCTSEIFSEFLQELDQKLQNEYQKTDGQKYMDNTRPHISHLVQERIQLLQNQVKLSSPYSYILNPIEYAFSKIKGIICQEFVNGLNELPKAIENSLSKITAEDCAGWYRLIRRHCAMAMELHHFE